jgi:hypothetical protein
MERLYESMAGTASPFIGAGVFGGARSQLAMGRTATEGLRDIAEQEARLRSQGFQGALGAYGSEQARQLAAAQALPQMAQAGVSGMMGAGALEQALGQKSLETAYQDFLRQQQYPQQQLSWLGGLATGVPTTSTTTKVGTETAGAPSYLQQASGIAGTLGELYNIYNQRNGGHIRRRYQGGGVVPMRRPAMQMPRRMPMAMAMPALPMMANPRAVAARSAMLPSRMGMGALNAMSMR